MSQPLYLKFNIQIEPLVDRWYAWPHLIPPATAARNMTHRHFPIMDSYLAAPAVHASAVKNPKLLGGPFIDYGGERAAEIRKLREETACARRPLLELSAALEQLERVLQTADGHTLEELYAQVPEPLQGFVELVYDIQNRASFRLIEPLLYRSRYYDRSAQSLTMGLTTGDERPFVLSTPRLPSPGIAHLPWAFDDERIDWLCARKRTPASWEAIAGALALSADNAAMFREFFTSDAPAPYAPYTGSGVRWRYFGHACILVETRRATFLLDPVLSYAYSSPISRYTYADLPDRIDYVLITHNHQDHILLETLLQIRHRVGEIVVPRSGPGWLQEPSIRLALEHIGFSRVRELGELEVMEFDGGHMTGVPFLGEHADLAVFTKLGYVLSFGDERLLFAADSCNIDPRMYEHLHAAIGDTGTIFLGMECDGAPMSWLYGPLLLRPVARSMDQSRRLSGSNFEQARGLVERFRCRDVYVYAMGQEPWLNHVMSIKYTEQSRPIVDSNRLVAACQARGVTAERLFGEKEILIDRIH